MKMEIKFMRGTSKHSELNIDSDGHWDISREKKYAIPRTAKKNVCKRIVLFLILSPDFEVMRCRYDCVHFTL